MGKSRSQSTSIDPRLAGASWEAIQEAQDIRRIPFMPNRGVRVAAFNPMQEAAFAGSNAAASAAGLPQGQAPGMPPVEMLNGVPGYSTGDMYDETVNRTVPQPIQDYINSFFLDPATGQMRGSAGDAPGGAPSPNGGQPNYGSPWGNQGNAGQYGNDGRVAGGGGTGSYGLPDPFGGVHDVADFATGGGVMGGIGRSITGGKFWG